MTTIKAKQVKSRIKCPEDQKKTFDALRLRKMSWTVEHETNPTTLDVVERVRHLASMGK